MRRSHAAILAGFLYCLLIGYFKAPAGVEMTVVSLVALLWPYADIRKRQIDCPLYLRLAVICAGIISISFAFTTNMVLISLSSAVVGVVVLGLLIVRAAGDAPEDLWTSYLACTVMLIQAVLRRLNPVFHIGWSKQSSDKALVRGILFSLVPLARTAAAGSIS